MELPKSVLLKYSIYKYIVFFIVLFILLLLLFHFIFYGTASLILLLFIFATVVVLTIIGIPRIIKGKKYNIVIVAVITLTIAFLSLFASYKIMVYESMLTESDAEIIVNALNEYYLNNKDYPEDINRLGA